MKLLVVFALHFAVLTLSTWLQAHSNLTIVHLFYYDNNTGFWEMGTSFIYLVYYHYHYVNLMLSILVCLSLVILSEVKTSLRSTFFR